MSPLKEISRNKLKKAEYLCNICKEVFGEESDYKIHLQQHEQKENKCTICGQIFANKWNLKRQNKILKRSEIFQRGELCFRNYSYKECSYIFWVNIFSLI